MYTGYRIPGAFPKVLELGTRYFPRPVAQLAEHRSPKAGVVGSIPAWPASNLGTPSARAAFNRKSEDVQ